MYKPKKKKILFGNPAKGVPPPQMNDMFYPQDQNGRSISPADTLDEVGYPRTNRLIAEPSSMGIFLPEENAVARPTKSPPPVLMPRPIHAIAPTRNLVLKNEYAKLNTPPPSSVQRTPTPQPPATAETDHSCESDYGDAKESAFTPPSDVEPSLTSASNSECISSDQGNNRPESFTSNPASNSVRKAFEGSPVYSSDTHKKNIIIASESSIHVSSASSAAASKSSSLDKPPQLQSDLISSENINSMRSRRTSTADNNILSASAQTIHHPSQFSPPRDDPKVTSVIAQENSMLRKQLDQLIMERDEQKQLEDEHKRRIDQMFDKVKELEGQLRRALDTNGLTSSKSTPTSVNRQSTTSGQQQQQRFPKKVTHGEIRHRVIPRIDELEDDVVLDRPRRKSVLTRPSNGNLRRVSLSQDPPLEITSAAIRSSSSSGPGRSRSRSRSRERPTTHRTVLPDEEIPYNRRETWVTRQPIDSKPRRRREYVETDSEIFSDEEDHRYRHDDEPHYVRSPRHSTPGQYRRPDIDHKAPLIRRRSFGSYPRRGLHEVYEDDYERVYVARVAVREPNPLRRLPSNIRHRDRDRERDRERDRDREAYYEEQRHHPRAYSSTQTRKHGTNIHYL